ncbi:MAG: hypothetical protein F6K65_18070 [Moorea sp. SIO3C2]|nr:hypothetical protein [Moorena sp. SIO3C2]
MAFGQRYGNGHPTRLNYAHAEHFRNYNAMPLMQCDWPWPKAHATGMATLRN